MTDGQTLFVVLCRYGPDAHTLREAAMTDHLAHLRRNRERLRFAGPLLADDGRTPAGSLAIVEVGDRAGAEDFLAAEAFYRAGMFDRVEIHRFRSEVDGRQVNTDLSPDGELYLWRWIATSDASADGAVRRPGTTAHAVRMIEAGALLDDDGETRIGGLAIVEAADAAAAHGLDTRDLLRPIEPRDEVLVSRWRFGKALGGA